MLTYRDSGNDLKRGIAVKRSLADAREVCMGN